MLEQLKKDEVEFVSLQFFDLLGCPKEVVIPESGFKEAAEYGIWFDGSSIEGFARIQESDLFLKPDLKTYSVVPWMNENGKTARVICDIYDSKGEPYRNDPRLILKRVASAAGKLGYKYNVGPEAEFYLLKKDSQSLLDPLDYSSYFDLSSYEGYKVIKEIVDALKGFGIEVETTHHEVGKGQYEVDFKYGDAVETADKLLTLKYTVKKVAQKHGLRATFIPKPIEGAPGSGMHVHQSLFDIRSNKNLFYDEKDKYGLSKIAYNFIAGQLKHIKSMCAILNPTVNSYKRLVTGFEAPVYITWASMNRSALIRVPRWNVEKSSSARIELRSPDLSCNPYLSFAVMLKAGLDGISKDLRPIDPVEENIYSLDDDSPVKKGIDTLPKSLTESLENLKEDECIKEVLGGQLSEEYINIKMREVSEYRMQVTPWEIEKYIDLF